MTKIDRQYLQPECIVLGVKPGFDPSSKPAVRIFLGTQPEQYRPERVFFWSLEQVRDPSRVYEIYLMKSMPGYRRTWLWNTGFTNYRFAIPHYAGYQGRAIYNDVDQTYHVDPAELFDSDMGEHAVLAVSRTDTSVMLLDCARMQKYWTLQKAQTSRKYPLISAVLADEGAYGLFDEGWNVRDAAFIPGQSKCYHYTILHYQPWQPLQERFYYRPNKEGGDLWLNLEKNADQFGYQVFTVSRPSGQFEQCLEMRDGELERDFVPPILADMTHALTDYTVASDVMEMKGKCTTTDNGHSGLVDVVRELRAAQTMESSDGLVLSVDLSRWPKQDLPWILDALFARTRQFIVGTVHISEASTGSKASRRLAMEKAVQWWNWALGAASAHYPDVCWRFALLPDLDSQLDDVAFCRGGAVARGSTPSVWVLADEKPGHMTQSLGLANALGWPFDEKKLQFNAWGEWPNALVQGTLKSLKATSDLVAGPDWPDLVIATGRRTAPIAAWIRQHSLGKTRTVQMGRIGTSLHDEFDLGVAPAYAGLYPDLRRMETAIPLTRVNQQLLDGAAAQWRDKISAEPPLVAVLVGGTNVEHEFSPACARQLAESVKAMVGASGGSVLLSTSRRTSRVAADILLSVLEPVCEHTYIWHRDKALPENPYLGYLALADAFIVTGESASMLAEACTTGKPVAIFSLPLRSASAVAGIRALGRWLGDAVARRAYAQPLNKRGIERPQRGVQRFCAGLLAKGLVRTGGHSQQLQASLISRGLAVRFDGKLPSVPTTQSNEMDRVIERVRAMLGQSR